MSLERWEEVQGGIIAEAMACQEVLAIATKWMEITQEMIAAGEEVRNWVLEHKPSI